MSFAATTKYHLHYQQNSYLEYVIKFQVFSIHEILIKVFIENLNKLRNISLSILYELISIFN